MDQAEVDMKVVGQGLVDILLVLDEVDILLLKIKFSSLKFNELIFTKTTEESGNKSDFFTFVMPEHVKWSDLKPETQKTWCHPLPVNVREKFNCNDNSEKTDKKKNPQWKRQKFS